MNALPVLPQVLADKVRQCRTLPSPPAVAMEVVRLGQKEDVGLQDVARALERDPVLAAKILKVANSARYAAVNPVTTLNRAVAMLGLNSTLSLALSFSVVRATRTVGSRGFDRAVFWRRAVACGVATRLVGLRTDAGAAEELFLAGLLQDIGMLVLNECLGATYGELVAAADGCHQRLVALEREKLGADHAAVGAVLLSEWKLPPPICQAVATSHDDHPEAPGPHDLARAVTTGGAVAGVFTEKDTLEAADVARRTAQRVLGMSHEALDSVLPELAAALPAATADLEVDVVSQDAVDRMLERAREALVDLNLQAQQRAREAEAASFHDALTGLHNRAFLERVLVDTFERAISNGTPLSVLFVDVDHFKRVNDTHGHLVGDEVLVSVAQRLRSLLRSSDVLVRYGGEEFLLLLPGTPAAGAWVVAERVRTAVGGTPHRVRDELRLPVTVSVGASTLDDKTPFERVSDLVEMADRAVYAAKQGGRNMVVHARSLGEGAPRKPVSAAPGA